jgi:hypothetical protein
MECRGTYKHFEKYAMLHLPRRYNNPNGSFPNKIHIQERDRLPDKTLANITSSDTKKPIITRTGTMICGYFQPILLLEDNVNSLSGKLNITELVLFAGDLNCQSDKANKKNDTILLYLDGEAITLLKRSHEPTYITHNKTRTINLSFHKKEDQNKITENSNSNNYQEVPTCCHCSLCLHNQSNCLTNAHNVLKKIRYGQK